MEVRWKIAFHMEEVWKSCEKLKWGIATGNVQPQQYATGLTANSESIQKRDEKECTLMLKRKEITNRTSKKIMPVKK